MTSWIRPITRKMRRKIKRACWLLKHRISPTKITTFTVDSHLGIKLQCPLGSLLGAALYVGEYESAELNFVRETLRAGDVFLDIGANAGLFTVLAAKCVGKGGRVFAFEPAREELELLHRNVALNGLTNVTVFPGAVSNQIGSARFAVAHDGGLSSLARTGHPLQSIKEWREVPTITLDEFLSREGVRQVNFIKIDVEGAEKLVLEGAGRLTRSGRPTIVFEAFDLNTKAFGYTVKDLLSSLMAEGFRISTFDDHGRLSPFTAYEPRFGSEIYNFVAQKP